MNRTVAPKSTRILAICAVVLSALSLVSYIAVVALQGQLKSMMHYPAEITASFAVPFAPVLANFALFVTHLVFCIILIASGNKPSWTKGKGIAFVSVEAALYVLSGILVMVLGTVETAFYTQYGAVKTAAYSVVSSLAAKTEGFLTGSVICALIAFSLICYKAALDKKAQSSMGGIR